MRALKVLDEEMIEVLLSPAKKNQTMQEKLDDMFAKIIDEILSQNDITDIDSWKRIISNNREKFLRLLKPAKITDISNGAIKILRLHIKAELALILSPNYERRDFVKKLNKVTNELSWTMRGNIKKS